MGKLPVHRKQGHHSKWKIFCKFVYKTIYSGEKKPLHLQEIIYASLDSVTSRRISKWEDEGIVRKIAPRIYTSNLEDSPEDIIQRNLFPILGNLYPEAVLSHRSAFEFAPTPSGQIFVTYKYTKKVELPGITIRFLEGPKAIKGDILFSGAILVAQRERALLENLQVSTKVNSISFPITWFTSS